MRFDPEALTRRSLLQGAAALAAVPLVGCRQTYSGTLNGPSFGLGHALRGVPLAGEPARTVRASVVILGGGIAGLAAGWELKRQGVRDVLTLELEGHLGGNSSAGKNAVSAYPLGAHYVPIINEDLGALRSLFEELGVIRGYGVGDLPLYEEAFVCAEPVERLYMFGRWQEGLLPHFGLKDPERAEIRRFKELMRRYGHAKGRDGRRAFAMPVDQSSRDPEFTRLDAMTMQAFLAEQGFSSPHLLWYVNYCCRDDYGADLAHASAWAGVHYFAARLGRAANAEPGAILTWPEGNGWLVRGLAERQAGPVATGSLVLGARTFSDRVEVDYWDIARSEKVRVVTGAAVCALPRFVAAKVVEGLEETNFQYAPWVVTNLTLSEPPPDGKGADLSWDNVSRYGASLGYVVANHQGFGMQRRETVITHYRPYTELPPPAARAFVGAFSHGDWAAQVVGELELLHHGIAKTVQNVDVWFWGHGMIRPDPGTIFGEERLKALQPKGRIHFAHSDLSGVSMFEEAFLRGVGAGEAAARTLARSV